MISAGRRHRTADLVNDSGPSCPSTAGAGWGHRPSTAADAMAYASRDHADENFVP